jgi:hypothetical protein
MTKPRIGFLGPVGLDRAANAWRPCWEPGRRRRSRSPTLGRVRGEARPLAPAGRGWRRIWTPSRARARRVVIATPSALHAEQSITAPRRGVAVFMPEAAWAYGGGGRGRRAGGPGRRTVCWRGSVLPLHGGHGPGSGSWIGSGGPGPGLCRGSGVSQRLRPGQGVVLRPDPVREAGASWIWACT